MSVLQNIPQSMLKGIEKLIIAIIWEKLTGSICKTRLKREV